MAYFSPPEFGSREEVQGGKKTAGRTPYDTFFHCFVSTLCLENDCNLYTFHLFVHLFHFTRWKISSNGVSIFVVVLNDALASKSRFSRRSDAVIKRNVAIFDASLSSLLEAQHDGWGWCEIISPGVK